ncbi:MAG: hypothetical protein QOE70_859 [Chthoniobacter sp.]|jgi:hypothetical protein|nr:hypothetical protein [Chthoniobacter sp.]
MIFQTQTAPVAQRASRSLSRPMLQRKCACGGSLGPSGECEACKKKRLGLQTKLEVNQPGDRFEQEADRIADQVITRTALPSVSSAALRLQRSPGPSNAQMEGVPASVDQALSSPGRPLDPPLRQDMEQRFGYDFSRVRVHSGPAAEQSAQDVGAQAYTVGHDIVFGARRFAPEATPGRRLLAHELTHVVQQTGDRNVTGPDPVPVRAFSAEPVLARACDAVNCPTVALPVGIFVPSWQLAEKCLQDHYQKSFPNSTVGFTKDWVGLTGKNPREQATLDCFRQHYTAKGFESDEARRKRRRARGQGPGEDIPEDRQGAAQRQAEPDIFDFTNLKIMEVTTPNGLAFRRNKIAWEVDLATDLMHECQIGAPNQWAEGFWEPEPCYQVVGAGPSLAGKLFFRTWRVGGVLVYMPVLDVTREAFAAAVAAAAAAASAAGKSGLLDWLRRLDWGRVGRNVAIAAAVMLAIALLIISLPADILAGIVAGIVALLGFLGFAFGAGSDGSGSGSGKRSGGSGGSGTAPPVVGPGPAPGGSRVPPSGTPQTTGPSAGDKVPVPPTGTTVPPAGTTQQPGGTTGSQTGPGSLLGDLLRLLWKLLGIHPPAAGTAARPGSSGSTGGPPAGPPPGDKVTVPRTVPPTKPPAGTTPPRDGSTVPPTTPPVGKQAVRPGTTRPAKSTGTSAGKQEPTTGSARSGKAEPQTIEVGSIEGLDLKKAAVGWWSFVFFDQGKPTEKLVLLGLAKIHTGAETVFEFWSGEGECTREGCGGRNIYTITRPYRASSPPAVNGVVIYSQLEGFFPHDPNLDDLADALDAAGKGTQADAVRSLAQRQKDYAKQKRQP